MKSNRVVGEYRERCGTLVWKCVAKQQEPLTAYGIARRIGFTPQWVNKVLVRKWFLGHVAYKVVAYGRGEKRVWLEANKAREVAEKEAGWVFAYDGWLL